MSRRFGKTPDLVGRASIALGLAKPAGDRCARWTTSTSPSRKGEVVGLVGESGCGKSTLGRIVAGILKPRPGRCCGAGGDIDTLSAADRAPRQPAHADGVPEPVRVDQPAPADRRDRGRGAARPRPDQGRTRGASRLRRRAAAPSRARSVAEGPLRASVLGRPAPAHRHRPRARGAARHSWSATKRSQRSTCRSRRRS